MRKSLSTTGCVVGCVLMLTAVAVRGEQAQPPRCESLHRLPHQVTLATLSNGLTVIVQENHTAPIATVRCFVKNTGSAYEGKYLGAGLSHVLEHVVAGGATPTRTSKEFEKIVDGFGGATNAATSTDMTTYFISCPAQNVPTAIELLADTMQHAKFEPSEFDRELKVVRRELADGEVNRGRVLWTMLNQTVYTTHPARHPVIGYLDVLNATTKDAIVDFYHRRYVPNNQVFVVAGDVDADAVLQQVAKQYAGTPRSYETYVPFEDEPRQLSPREATREMDGAAYDMVFAWPTVKLSDSDLFALDVAAYILGEGESSRLVQRLKYQEQSVLSVGVVSDTPHYVNGVFTVSAVSRPETWQKAADSIVREVYRLRDELVQPDELAKAKNQKAAELVFGRQTAEQEAESLGRNFLATGDPLFDARYVEGIQKVTAEQVRDAARRYFTPERLNRVTIAPPGGATQSAAKTSDVGKQKVRLVRLPNGLRVLLKRRDDLPLVNLQAIVLGGSLVDDDATAGRAALVGAMLDMGTADHSARQIADYFDSIGAQFGMSAGRFTVLGGVTALKADFPGAAALFAECFCRPTFPEAEYAKVQRLALGAIARRADDPYQEINELFAKALPSGTPYHVLQGGTIESVRRLTAADLRAYHARYFVPENMIVTVFGDIEPDAALQQVEKLFGRLKPAGDQRPAIRFDQSNALPETVVRRKTIAKPTAMALFGYPTSSILEKQDYAAMTLLDAIMSGYSYPGGWLHEELRGEGLVYFVHAFQATGPAAGYFQILAQTRPDKLDEVVGRILRNVDRAKQGKIEQEEFGTAQRMVIALHAQQNTTIASQAQEAALDELYGLGYDYRAAFDERIRAVTLPEVVRAAQKYFGRPHVLVTSSPEKKEESKK
ncbi:MAG: pitrilysin family protein [Thermoguttaceae bacterium]